MTDKKQKPLGWDTSSATRLASSTDSGAFGFFLFFAGGAALIAICDLITCHPEIAAVGGVCLPFLWWLWPR